MLKRTLPFVYIPKICCPFCSKMINCEELDNIRQIWKHDFRVECDQCGEPIPFSRIKLIKRWECTNCKTEFLEGELIDLNNNQRYECPECGNAGKINKPFKVFKVRQRKGGYLEYICPYPKCRGSYPKSELKPNGDGVIAICPVCSRFAELPPKEMS